MDQHEPEIAETGPEGGEDVRASPTRSSPEEAGATARLQILVVEDLPQARDALGELLTLHGHDVTLAADGEEALRIALSHTPDVALVDIGLPGLDGYEVARRLRTASHAHLRLVAMTGYGQPESRDRAAAAGFDQYLVKPVDPAELLELLAAKDDGNAPP